MRNSSVFTFSKLPNRNVNISYLGASAVYFTVFSDMTGEGVYTPLVLLDRYNVDVRVQ